MILYHGTKMVVRCPEVRVSGYNKDFGFGFYCTRYEKQAKRFSREAFWALARFKHPTHQIVFCTDRALVTLSYKSHYQL